jgi:hypothetical protein
MRSILLHLSPQLNGGAHQPPGQERNRSRSVPAFTPEDSEIDQFIVASLHHSAILARVVRTVARARRCAL